MTIKSQLHATGDSLMVAVRAAERAPDPDQHVLKTLRACQDIIEKLEQSAGEVRAVQVEMALTVVQQALIEFGRQEHPAPAVLGAVRNAVDRLQKLRSEFPN
jgi:hypothetical protein